MSYRKLDMNTYERKDYLKHFKEMSNPFVETTVQVEITDFYNKVRGNNLPFFISLMYIVGKTANSIPQFRHRLIDDEVYEYDKCDCSYTVSTSDNKYAYCAVNNSLDYDEFIVDSRKRQTEAEKQTTITEPKDPNSCFFCTCLPWFSFTNLQNPYPNNRFSVPMFTFGKYYTKDEVQLIDNKVTVVQKRYLPCNVFIHHGLVDGRQIGEFYNKLEENLKEFSK